MASNILSCNRNTSTRHYEMYRTRERDEARKLRLSFLARGSVAHLAERVPRRELPSEKEEVERNRIR